MLRKKSFKTNAHSQQVANKFTAERNRHKSGPPQIMKMWPGTKKRHRSESTTIPSSQIEESRVSSGKKDLLSRCMANLLGLVKSNLKHRIATMPTIQAGNPSMDSSPEKKRHKSEPSKRLTDGKGNKKLDKQIVPYETDLKIFDPPLVNPDIGLIVPDKEILCDMATPDGNFVLSKFLIDLVNQTNQEEDELTGLGIRCGSDKDSPKRCDAEEDSPTRYEKEYGSPIASRKSSCSLNLNSDDDGQLSPQIKYWNTSPKGPIEIPHSESCWLFEEENNGRPIIGDGLTREDVKFGSSLTDPSHIEDLDIREDDIVYNEADESNNKSFNLQRPAGVPVDDAGTWFMEE